jgi:hypothetical protein
MTEDGAPRELVYIELLQDPPPQKRSFFPFWLATRFHFPEPNYCIRRQVMLDCFPPQDSQDYFDMKNPFLKCVYTFNTKGYLSYFVPTVANYFKTHSQQLSETKQEEGCTTIKLYHAMLATYGRGVMKGEIRHSFRDGLGAVIGEIGPDTLVECREEMQRHVRNRAIYLYERSQAIFTILDDLSPQRRFLLMARVTVNRLCRRIALRLGIWRKAETQKRGGVTVNYP